MAHLTTHISICRPENAAWLRAELSRAGLSKAQQFKAQQSKAQQPKVQQSRSGEGAGLSSEHILEKEGPCWISWPMEFLPNRFDHRKMALVFEQQRLAHARFFPGKDAVELARLIARTLLPTTGSGSGGQDAGPDIHVIGCDRQGRPTTGGRAEAFHKTLSQHLGKPSSNPPFHRLNAEISVDKAALPDRVLQCLLTPDGVWGAVMPQGELVSPFPGGISDLRLPEQAPSRSYLKIAEALRVSGWRPRARETVVDLGAAPGGWSYAFLQQGCRVLAVDNGPMKIPGLDELPGQLTHLREDGLRFTPPAVNLPVDWLLSDMLVSPGVCLGLLKKWIGRGWMRRFVVNMKIPQKEPISALQPMQDFLEGISGLSWRIRQLYHDRREVTLLGAFHSPPTPTHLSEKAHPERAKPAKGNIRIKTGRKAAPGTRKKQGPKKHGRETPRRSR